LAEQEYRLLIEVAASPEQVTAVLRARAGAGVCDGFVLRAFEERDPAWTALAQFGRPFIIIGQCADPVLPSIAHDAPGMVHAALRLLAGRGHRRVGLLLERRSDVYHRLCHETWLAAAPDYALDGARWIAEGAGRVEAEAIVSDWLSQPEAPTAIFGLGDRPAFGAASAAVRASRRIGAGFDVVVAATGGLSWLYEPGTWCFAMDLEQIGRRAAAELGRLLDGSPSPGAIRVLPQLVRI